MIWGGSCFGGCEIPLVEKKDIDLIVQFGHRKWDYSKESGIKVVK